MAVSPQQYIEDTKHFNFNEMIDNLFNNRFINEERTFNICLDIGCGPGLLTKVLAEKVKHNKLIAIDLDPNMLSVCEKYNTGHPIVYLCQDITESWDQLSPQLQGLGDKVEFIHSSATLHWIVMKDKVISNFSKLLSNNGLLFVSLLLVPDLTQRVSEEFKSKTNIEWLSIGSQINYLNQLFIENGFKIIKVVLKYKNVKKTGEEFLNLFTNLCKMYKIYFKCNDNTEYDVLWDQFVNYSSDALLDLQSPHLDCDSLDKIKASGENGGAYITPLPGCMPLKPGSAVFPFFGILPAILDTSGNELEGEAIGQFTLKKSWPSLALTIDGRHEVFEEIYFKQFNGYNCSGDMVRRDRDGYYWMIGRCDDNINVSGHLLSTVEVENVIAEHRAVAEVSVVSAPHPIKGECLYVFVVLNSGFNLSTQLSVDIKSKARERIGGFAEPDTIQVVSAPAKTKTGKTLRRILYKLVRGDNELCDTSAIADESVLVDLIKQFKN